MRTHKPIDLVTELIRSAEPTTRGNATVALGALGSAESTSMLVEVAFTDKDADVRARAQQELRLLGSKSESLKNVTAAMHDRLRDRETRITAYVLLGQLRSQGLSIPLPKMTIAERVSLAAGSRTRSLQTYYYRAIALGTLVASAAMLVFSLQVAPKVNVGDLIAIFFFCSCLAPMVTLFMFSRLWLWKPVSLETDRLGAILADSRLAVVAGSTMGAVIVIVCLIMRSLTSWKFVWAPIVGGIAAMLAVRVGSALAFGTFKRRTWDVPFEALAGGAAGTAVLSLLQLRSYQDPLAATAWLALVPISFGLATAISGVDHQDGPLPSRIFGRAPNFAMGALSIAVLCSALLAGSPPKTSCVAAVDDRKTISDSSFPLVPGRSLPCSVHVGSQSQATVTLNQATVALNEKARGDFRLAWAGQKVSGSTPVYTSYIAFTPGGATDNLVETLFTNGEYNFSVEPVPVSSAPVAVLTQAGKILSQRAQQILRPGPLLEKDTPSVQVAIKPLTPDMPVAGNPVQLNNWCWSQSVKGSFSESNVKQACQDAVSRSGNNFNYRDSRGLNRALNGDYQGAIDDFTAFATASQDPKRIAERRKWIAQLQKHQNPFTPAELSRLASE